MQTKEEKLAYVRAWNKRRKLILKDKVDALLGFVCKRCGFSDIRALCIDHVYNDGAAMKRTIGNKCGYVSTVALYRQVLRAPERYQRLCWNCNWIKEFERRNSILK